MQKIHLILKRYKVDGASRAIEIYPNERLKVELDQVKTNLTAFGYHEKLLKEAMKQREL